MIELSEVKWGVKMVVNSLRSWELKWTIPYQWHNIRPAHSA